MVAVLINVYAMRFWKVIFFGRYVEKIVLHQIVIQLVKSTPADFLNSEF